MLDSEAKDDVLAPPVEAAETPDNPEVPVETPDEPEELVITIQGEEPEPDEDAEAEAELGDKGKRALQRAREAAKAAAAEAREVKAKLAEIEARTRPPEVELVRPTPEDCGFNDDVYAERMMEYLQAKAKLDAKKAEADAEARADEARYKEKLDGYHATRAKFGIDDDVQDRVVSQLSPAQQSILRDTCGDPAKVVAALASSPKKLAALAGEKKPLRFAYELAKLEGSIQMTAKTPPPPESKLRGGTATPGGSLAAQLEAAEKRADMTGDRTEVQRIKRQMREAGVAY
jgi:hypothetical protein